MDLNQMIVQNTSEKHLLVNNKNTTADVISTNTNEAVYNDSCLDGGVTNPSLYIIKDEINNNSNELSRDERKEIVHHYHNLTHSNVDYIIKQPKLIGKYQWDDLAQLANE
eukprot:Pgem_evm1s323